MSENFPPRGVAMCGLLYVVAKLRVPFTNFHVEITRAVPMDAQEDEVLKELRVRGLIPLASEQ